MEPNCCFLKALSRFRERLSQLKQRNFRREEQHEDLQKLNRTLVEKIDSLKSQLVSTREELLVERQLGQNLQITVTELRAENDRLEQDGQQFELDRINLEKHCEELNQQVNQQAELLAQMDSMRPVECPRVADNVVSESGPFNR
ncbi:hypothetical protein FGIG_07973 [Fasciola gigantica]|uniref:Uncharacterized protein n=1 Tax=Fasciola gigantica TaxID=46835 RepID=A0A504YLL8_FASGI|nr:hypothetical protein FGIG_07973 [Fasciola gigantica]